MRPSRSAAAVCAALALTAAAAAARAGPTQREYASTARTLAGLTPGKPIGCISLSRSQESSFLDPDTIAYRDTARRYYVNRTSGGCHFSDDTIVVSRTPSDQLCRGDILSVIDRSARMPTGACGLGDFVPYTR